MTSAGGCDWARLEPSSSFWPGDPLKEVCMVFIFASGDPYGNGVKEENLGLNEKFIKGRNRSKTSYLGISGSLLFSCSAIFSILFDDLQLAEVFIYSS